MQRRLIAFVGGLSLCGSLVSAADLCVKTAGNDATAKGSISYIAGNEAGSTCWATIGRAAWGSTNRAAPSAAAAAAAGDTVYVFGGTYSYTGSALNSRWNVVYHTAASGTAGNLITFTALASVTLEATTTNSPIIGCDTRDYIKWSGPFLIDEAVIDTAPDTGPVVLHDAEGCVIDGITVDGNDGHTIDDNHSGIRIEACDYCEVRNSTVSAVHNNGWIGAGNPRVNGNCIEVYAAPTYGNLSFIIEHNTLSDCGTGIFLKSATSPDVSPGSDDTYIRYNLITDCAVGFYHMYVRDAGNVYVYQNIIYGHPVGSTDTISTGIQLHTQGTTSQDKGPIRSRIVNNTIDDVNNGFRFISDGGGFADNADNEFYNNVATNTTAYAISSEIDDGADAFATSRTLFERNLYDDYTTAFMFEDTAGITFATWQSTFSGQDANSIVDTDPQYVNEGTHDYHIQNATAQALGRVVYSICGVNGATIHVGAHCDSSTIGVVSGTDTTDPVVTITTNDGANFGTSTTPTTLAGTCTDDGGVASVTWVNAAGGSGTAAGTTSWSDNIALTSGANEITVTCTDTSANDATDSLTVTYTPQQQNPGTGMPRALPRRLAPGDQQP